MKLKVQLEYARRMEEMVRIQLNKKEENCEEIESETVSLRKELEKPTITMNKILNLEKCIDTLDKIIDCQSIHSLRLVLYMIFLFPPYLHIALI